MGVVWNCGDSDDGGRDIGGGGGDGWGAWISHSGARRRSVDRRGVFCGVFCGDGNVGRPMDDCPRMWWRRRFIVSRHECIGAS